MAVRIRPKDLGARKPHRPSQVPPEAQAPRMFQETHAGMSGKNNEDAVETGVVPGPNGRPRYVAIVADGIGGHASGEVASHMALRHVMDFLNQHPMAPLPQALVQAVTRANQAVFTESQKKDLWKGMGTTLTIAVVEDGCLYLAHGRRGRLPGWTDHRSMGSRPSALDDDRRSRAGTAKSASILLP